MWLTSVALWRAAGWGSAPGDRLGAEASRPRGAGRRNLFGVGPDLRPGDDGFQGLDAAVAILDQAPRDVAHAGRIGLAAFGDLGGHDLEIPDLLHEGLDVVLGELLRLGLQPTDALGHGLALRARLDGFQVVVGDHAKRR